MEQSELLCVGLWAMLPLVWKMATLISQQTFSVLTLQASEGNKDHSTEWGVTVGQNAWKQTQTSHVQEGQLFILIKVLWHDIPYLLLLKRNFQKQDQQLLHKITTVLSRPSYFEAGPTKT